MEPNGAFTYTERKENCNTQWKVAAISSFIANVCRKCDAVSESRGCHAY